MEAAGQLEIAFTTGILVGIGETRSDRLVALRAIAASHARHGHVQEVIVQNFLPKRDTAMHSAQACPAEEHLWSVAAARLVLPPGIHLQAPPNLTDDFSELFEAGIDDWGGVSPVTADHVNPERAWPELERLKEATERRGHVLAPRLAVHPELSRGFVADELRHAVMDRADSEGLARDSDWCSGGEAPAPLLVPGEWLSSPGRDSFAPLLYSQSRRPGSSGAVAEVLAGVLSGDEVGEDEIVTLFRARGLEVRRRRRGGRRASPPGGRRRRHLRRQPQHQLHERLHVQVPILRLLEGTALAQPAREPLSARSRRDHPARRGGRGRRRHRGVPARRDPPRLRRRVLPRGARRPCGPRLSTSTSTPSPPWRCSEGARRLAEPLETYLVRLREAGLQTLPGTAAEILDDEIRAVLCPDKIETDEWLEVHRMAHGVGLRSNVTIMFGAVEDPRHWARHIVRTRDAAKRDGGLHRVRAPSLRAHGERRSTCRKRHAGARLFARRS